MNGRIIVRVLLALILIAGLVGIGTYVYNAGVAQGLTASGKLTTPDGAAVPYPYYGPFLRPFGFGFGYLGLLFPLFFLFLFFGVLRAIFWRGRWGGGWRGDREHWKDHVPPMAEEWHRRMHESQPKKE